LTGNLDIEVANAAGTSANSASDRFFFEGWESPTPPDKSTFDVNVGQAQDFSVRLREQSPLTIGYEALDLANGNPVTWPSFVTCSPNSAIPGNVSQGDGYPAQVDCHVAPAGEGLVFLRFFDAQSPERVNPRITPRFYVVGRGKYFALGDSFSSGEGNPAFRTQPEDKYDTGADGCHRSDAAYPAHVANTYYGGPNNFGSGGGNNPAFAACSGATIRDVIWGRNHEDPQISQLDGSTDLVTISAGGDDVGFKNIATDCLIRGSLLLNLNAGGGLWSCRSHDDAEAQRRITRIGSLSASPTDLSQATTSTTPSDDPNSPFTLQNLYYTIQQKAPHARIVVLGYPHLLPSPDSSCNNQLPIAWLNGIAQEIDDKILAAAAAVGAEYIPGSYDAFNGHELCTDQLWVNNLDTSGALLSGIDLSRLNPFDPSFGDYVLGFFPNVNYSLHPNAQGQSSFAQLMNSQVASGSPGASDLVTPGQTTSAPVNVAPDSGQESFQSSWPGSDVIMSLSSPSGRVISRATSAPDVVHTQGPTFETFTILHPEAGQWTVHLLGANVAADGEMVRLNSVAVPAVNFPPVAIASSDVSNGSAPLTVNFDGSASYDPDGRVDSYSWDFGDGTTGSGAKPSHAYTKPGVYEALLTVTDDGGAMGYNHVHILVREPVKLVYSGTSTSDYNDPAQVSAVLTSALDGHPINGAAVIFNLGGGAGGTCTGVTNSSGVAGCALTPSLKASPSTITAQFAQTYQYGSAAVSSPFAVTREESALAVSAPSALAQGSQITLSGTLTEDGSTPLSGRQVAFTVGSGSGTQSCSATTTGKGVATCSITLSQPLGPASVTASFLGDDYYLPSGATASTVVFAYTTGGAFVVGDQSVGTMATATGKPVTFWSDQWSKANSLSGGAPPSSFKGFENSTPQLACGGSWTAGTGNNTAPPVSIPTYTAVVVSSGIAKNGSSISGDIQHVVIVKLDAGYQPAPGHPGTGTVVAVLC
jgi:PKD repeat protein